MPTAKFARCDVCLGTPYAGVATHSGAAGRSRAKGAETSRRESRSAPGFSESHLGDLVDQPNSYCLRLGRLRFALS